MSRRWFVLLPLLWLAGCQSRVDEAGEAPVARFWLETDAARAVVFELPVSGVRVSVLPRPVFSEFDVMEVELAEVELGRCLMFRLSAAAARDLHRLTSAQPGRRLVLVLDDRPVGARVIDHPIADGIIHTFVEIPDARLPEVVAGLKRTTAQLRRETMNQR